MHKRQFRFTRLFLLTLLWQQTAIVFAQSDQQTPPPPPAPSPPPQTQQQSPYPSQFQPYPQQQFQPYQQQSQMPAYGQQQAPSAAGLKLQGQVEQAQITSPPGPPPGATQPPPGYLFGNTQGWGAPLQGQAHSGTAPYFPGQSMPGQTAPLQNPNPLRGQATDSAHPAWLPAYAYSNDAMVTPYHNMDIFFWDKKPIPNKPQWAKLSTSVSRYWKGPVADPNFVLIEPMPEAPGNFTFKSRNLMAPRGWLQSLPRTDAFGFPLYKYWLDQR